MLHVSSFPPSDFQTLLVHNVCKLCSFKVTASIVKAKLVLEKVNVKAFLLKMHANCDDCYVYYGLWISCFQPSNHPGTK